MQFLAVKKFSLKRGSIKKKNVSGPYLFYYETSSTLHGIIMNETTLFLCVRMKIKKKTQSELIFFNPNGNCFPLPTLIFNTFSDGISSSVVGLTRGVLTTINHRRAEMFVLLAR